MTHRANAAASLGYEDDPRSVGGPGGLPVVGGIVGEPNGVPSSHGFDPDVPIPHPSIEPLKAIFVPSGDHVGEPHMVSPSVRVRGVPPPEGTTRTLDAQGDGGVLAVGDLRAIRGPRALG